jgi:hypothetical protein
MGIIFPSYNLGASFGFMYVGLSLCMGRFFWLLDVCL